MVEMLGLRKPTPTPIRASEKYMIWMAVASCWAAPCTPVAAWPVQAMPSWPSTSREPPKITALRMPR